ncbi:DUF2065 domain-containing protein [Marinicauda salina]|uniref:DUF2065 domain-containing protein n=1 Tax=Marinicauda salina TaxID=2135793 RepID=A0A2U2BST2_9PROT|nr:DUF2065 family protein [Marinicauda salina]PWE17050.1 DUF2065 domain-containing protein [Marinicauda salina]
MAQTLLLGLGVALAIEGAAYAAAPGLMKRLAARVGLSEPGDLRIAGLVALSLGVALVAIVR